MTASPRTLIAAGLLALLASCRTDGTGPIAASGRTQMRAPTRSWKDQSAKYLERFRGSRRSQVDSLETASALDEARSLDHADLGSIPLITSDELARAFVWMRDSRFLHASGDDEFLRRDSWLYPDDGCYARATLAARRMALLGLPSPKKIFIFGDLEIETSNSPDGKVWWWYHVAPTYRTGDGADLAWVIDPAIAPRGPLPLQKWIQLQAQDAATAEVAICEIGTYEPGSSCLTPSPGDSDSAITDEQWFLDLEWGRQLDLGREPRAVLGEHPPWQLWVTDPERPPPRARPRSNSPYSSPRRP